MFQNASLKIPFEKKQQRCLGRETITCEIPRTLQSQEELHQDRVLANALCAGEAQTLSCANVATGQRRLTGTCSVERISDMAQS